MANEVTQTTVTSPHPAWTAEIHSEGIFNVRQGIENIHQLMNRCFSEINQRLTRLEQRTSNLEHTVRNLGHQVEDFTHFIPEEELETVRGYRILKNIFENLPIPVRETKLIPDQDSFEDKNSKELKRIETQAQQQHRNNQTRFLLGNTQPEATFNDGSCFTTLRGTRYDTEYYIKKGVVHENEDRFCHFMFESFNIECWATFDGHGGKEVSQFCSDNFSSSLRKCLIHLNQKGEIFEIANALKTSFVHLDSLILNEALNTFYTTQPRPKVSPGCTACAILKTKTHLLVGNAGDCRVILVRGENCPPIQLSYDYKSTDPYAQRTVTKRGGKLQPLSSDLQGNLRVESSLAITRAIGNEYLRINGNEKVISCRPRVTFIDYTELTFDECLYAVICTDGLTDVASNASIAQIVLEAHRKNKTAIEISNELVLRGKSAGSTDDITVGVFPIF